MNSGSIASGGIGRSISTTGSTTLRTAREVPRGQPEGERQRARRFRSRWRRARASPDVPQSWPLDGELEHACRARARAPARKIGLKSFRRTTSPDARLQSARKASTAPARRARARRRGSAAPRRPHCISSVRLLRNTRRPCLAPCRGLFAIMGRAPRQGATASRHSVGCAAPRMLAEPARGAKSAGRRQHRGLDAAGTFSPGRRHGSDGHHPAPHLADSDIANCAGRPMRTMACTSGTQGATPLQL